MAKPLTAEHKRLAAEGRREENWKRWGPYLPDRQWGTVREDYSADGEAWRSFTHDQARSRAYRWGEDGLLGLCDRQGRLCFSWALWNEQDPILKERLFGLTGPEGNHGEDVKELYYFADATPTSSYLKAVYKYPQAAFPYEQLVEENGRRGLHDREFELADTGVFNEGRYFDIVVEYAKASPHDILIRLTAHNRGPDAAPLHLIPTLWHRNTWDWGRTGEGYWPRGPITLTQGALQSEHPALQTHRLEIDGEAKALFCENATNNELLFGSENTTPWPKDAFHRHIVDGELAAVSPLNDGSKAAFWRRTVVKAGGQQQIRLRLRRTDATESDAFEDFDRVFAEREAEAEAYHRHTAHVTGSENLNIVRQANAGLMWSRKFYYYDVESWIAGDPSQPPPPAGRSRNREWKQLYNRDILSMPDAWEYPWYAAWDLAFHMIPFTDVDPDFAKSQLVLLLREWYLHPNGCLPAYEYNFSDVNPPVHAWAAWRVYKMTGERGERDLTFLARVFQKLLLNFTWWVNRKDERGNNLFAGGFLGLDNIGVFDRSKPLPDGAELEQADGTAWMAFYASTMMSMALELAKDGALEYGDLASKFFEHFIAIVDAMNDFDGGGLWDDRDGFYYDRLIRDGEMIKVRTRSLVGLVPLFAVEVLEDDQLHQTPGFEKRLRWFLKNRPDLSAHISILEKSGIGRRLLAVPNKERLQSVLRYVFDEAEFLSPFGVRSMSRIHEEMPFEMELGGQHHTVRYVSGESDSWMFGGNSNWRGPVWLPMNFLLIEALERYHHFYGDSLKVEVPTGSGRWMDLQEAALEICRRLARLFTVEENGRACHGGDPLYADPAFSKWVLFYEYFDGDSGRGLGASHQTGWTALITRILQKLERT